MPIILTVTDRKTYVTKDMSTYEPKKTDTCMSVTQTW